MLKENLNKVFHVICPFNSQLNASEESGEKTGRAPDSVDLFVWNTLRQYFQTEWSLIQEKKLDAEMFES